MDEETSAKIKQLKQEASNKGIFHKAIGIAELLGKVSYKKHGAWHDWNDDEMQINYDDYGSNISIDYRGVIVFVAQLGNVIRYRPDVNQGDWIEKIDFLYSEKVDPANKKTEEGKRNAEAQELFDTWGITITTK